MIQVTNPIADALAQFSKSTAQATADIAPNMPALLESSYLSGIVRGLMLCIDVSGDLRELDALLVEARAINQAHMRRT